MPFRPPRVSQLHNCELEGENEQVFRDGPLFFGEGDEKS